MEILIKQIPANANIFLFGDKHQGSIMSFNKGWKVLCDTMNSKWNGITRNYGIDHGDFCEGITIDDPRYDPRTITQPIPALQVDDSIEDYQPIRDKIVVMLDGNHPRKLWKFDYMTPRLCHALDIPFGTLSCKVHWVDKNNDLMFKSFHTHGRKQINSAADDPLTAELNMMRILRRVLRRKAGDCYLMCRGHTHKLIILPPTAISNIYDKNRIEQHRYTTSYIDQTAEYIHDTDRWYVSTGSFLKLRDTQKRMVYKGKSIGISGYAEAADYDPLDLGFAVAEVRNKKLVQVREVRILGSGKVEVNPPID